ncbi:RCC1-like domain-containing protein [Paenibacillus taichungensis]|uniref:RCC1-like domain-containing protein n=1 Tax=Paenibacillus taichungensis TaxID=484184 RepID=UPI0035D95B4F
MDNTQKKKKYKFSIGWKRSLIVTLVIALLLGTYSFADFGSKAQAAEYDQIKNIRTYALDKSYTPWSATTLEMVSGKSVILPTTKSPAYVSPEGVNKFNLIYNVPYGSNGGSSTDLVTSYITTSGDLYIKDNLIASDVLDFVSIGSIGMILNKNGTVDAWGKGSNGELGIGYKQNKQLPTEVVDPATGDPIQGIKKIFVLSHHGQSPSILLISNTEVYLVGKAFGLDSRTSGSPIKVEIFPAFTNADFNIEFLEGVSNFVETARIGGFGGATNYSGMDRRIFTISGKKYALRDIKGNDQAVYSDALETSLIPLEDDFDPMNFKKSSKVYYYGGSYYDRNIINTYLKDGVLTSWGADYLLYGTSNSNFKSDPVQIATGVSYATNNRNGQFWYIRNNSLYAIGTNVSSQLGVDGGYVLTPVKITGSSNEVKNVASFAVVDTNKFVLRDDGYMITFTKSSDFKTSTRKYLGMFSFSEDAQGNNKAYAIGEDYKLYELISTTQINLVGDGVIPALVPADFVAPVTAPEQPILSITSQDKFNQSVVSINFGTTGNIASKQYQINGGGWLDYTGEILITQSGNVTIQARSADSKGNISEVGELTLTSNPIVITAGDPRFEKISANEFKIHASASGNIKVQVKVDGATWQDFNVANNLLLTPGSHTVDVRLLNERDQELINKTFNVTADSPAPVVVAKPVVTQKGLNNLYGLDIEVTYNVADGEAQYSIDGGSWTTTTGSFSVSNAAHTIRAKVVTAGGKESEITEFVTTASQPKITVSDDQIYIDLGINTNDVTVYYKDSNNQWVEYTGPVTYGPGTHNIEIEVRDRNTGIPVFTGGPYTVTVIDPNPSTPGDGGTTPKPDPGTGTPVGEEDVDFTVNSGGLFARFEGADLSTIIIDSTNPYQSINSVSRALFEDSRGNAEGYQYSMDVTDFVSDPMQDNSNLQQSLVVSIPANALSVNVLSTKTLNGPVSELSHIGKHVFTGTGPEMLATAKAFEGMGYYEVPLEFTLSVPDRVKIVSSGSGSKFVPGESTGLMAGIYKSKITLTLSSGI